MSNCSPCNDCPPENVVNLPECEGGEPCEEILNSSCVKYTGANLPNLGVEDGMRLKAVLVALNKLYPITTTDYTITVLTTQKTTVVEYIDASGDLQSISVSKDQSPQTITAQTDSPVIISGTGTVA